MSPPTQFIPMGMPVHHLCQVFNYSGKRTLILQPTALILLKEAREPWQGSHMRKTMLVLPLPTCRSLLGDPCAHTCSTFAEDPSSYHEHRFSRQEQAKTHQEGNMPLTRAPQLFLLHHRFSPLKDYMQPVLPSHQIVVVSITIPQSLSPLCLPSTTQSPLQSPLHAFSHLIFTISRPRQLT